MKTLIVFALSLAVYGQPALESLNPRVQQVVDAVSPDRIAAVLQKLESFGTRNPHSSTDDPQHGTGAARRWIIEQLRSYSPRLEVREDRHAVKKGGRFVRDLDIVNIVAILPGTTQKDRHVIVSGHYDSMVIVRKKEAAADPDAPLTQTADWDATANAPIAPGVSDDASGTAVTMELARVMSQREWNKTLVFIAFDAEEEGLVGSTRFADEAKKAAMTIDGVLNNDIVGNDVGGSGKKESSRVYVFSDDPADGPSRSLARFIHDTSARYVPSMTVDLVFRPDRFSRGGDHTPMNNAGYPAVRFTTEAENYANQHTVTDSFANASLEYTASVARVNGAAAAALALAPAAPDVTREVKTGVNKGRRVANLGRGKSGYDAVLKWTAPADAQDIAGYVVAVRRTTAPLWEREIYVGNVTEYTLKNTSIDDVVLGVKSVDKDGDESPVAAYALPARMNFEGVTPAQDKPEK